MRIAITTKHVWMCGFALLLAPLPQVAADTENAEQGASSEHRFVLQIGDRAPEFEAVADSGELWRSKDHEDGMIRVVYFYPADFSSGCSKQAEQFRDNMQTLVKHGVEVIGVSGDSVESHQLFKDQQHLNFTLLADQDGSVARKFGVPVRKGGRVVPHGPNRKPLTDEDGEPLVPLRDVTLARWTFVIANGRIIYKDTRVSPAHDSRQILYFLSKDEK